MRIGVLGAGVISKQYLENLTRFPDVEVALVADLDTSRARDRAEAFGVLAWGTSADLLTSDVELVVNLTVPAAHHDTTVAALRAGKHVWLEKPLATNVADARDLVAVAKACGREVGCAPDTVLGAPAQAALRLLADGAAGTPSWGYAQFATEGPQGWHPDPEFLFSPGGGPLLDVGPYYLTMLAHAFGPVARVYAAAATAQQTRTIGAGPRAGTVFPVTAATTLFTTLHFSSGATAQATFSFDSASPHIALEFTGSEGTIVCADPNRFAGDVVVRSAHGAEPQVASFPEATATRGIGVVEMVRAIEAGRRPRANDDVAAHLVEVMAAALTSVERRLPVDVDSSFDPVEPLPEGWDPFRR